MDLIAAFFIALSFLCALLYFSRRTARRASVLSTAGLSPSRADASTPSLSAGSHLRALLARVGRLLPSGTREELKGLLAQSGVAWSYHYLQGLRLGCGLALAAPVFLLGLTAFPLAPLLFAAGYHLPVMMLKRKLARRWEKVAAELPEIVDLMAVLCFSGESLYLALRHSISACVHPLTRAEVGGILEHIQLGESAAEALRHAADHPCRELRRFCRALLRAEEYGAPIADTLEDVATELRNVRREKERVWASRVSVLILFPLVFLILPSFLLLTVGGMILGYTL